MVKTEYIIKAIKDYVKCHPTINEMRTALQTKTHQEHHEELLEKGLLNPLEQKDIIQKMEVLDRLKTRNRIRPQKSIQREIDGIEHELFQYERRLIEGLKEKPVPDINIDTYRKDTQYTTQDELKDKTLYGKLEQDQITEQEKHVNQDTIAEETLYSIGDYYSGNMGDLNKNIKNGKYLKQLQKEDRSRMKEIDKAIDKSPGLLQDTTLYMGGPIDIHLKPGDHSHIKGYMSTSYQETIAENFRKRYPDNFKYVIRAKAGTKGLCANSSLFNDYTFHNEHEYLLGRNTGFTVKSIDYDNKEIEVILDG